MKTYCNSTNPDKLVFVLAGWYNKVMKNEISKFVFWTPRILSIIFIAFLALFSLDIFGNGYSFWETVLGLFMHNVPSLILLIILIISWKREMVGAVAFILAGILYIFFAFSHARNLGMALVWTSQISVMAFVIGGFFLANWIKKKNISKEDRS